MKVVLTIAGSDSSGGAGIQADIKTFEAFGVFGTSVLTVLTAQNTKGVEGIFPVDPSFVKAQLNSVFDDFDVAAVKIGMLFSNEVIEAVRDFIKELKIPVVFDPVFISKAGSSLLSDDSVQSLKELLQYCTVTTPNLYEAKKLFNYEPFSNSSLIYIQNSPCPVVVKNHQLMIENEKKSVDILYMDDNKLLFDTPFLESNNTHGTGCSYSSAISANLALGYTLKESITISKKFIYHAIKNAPQIGHGKGPVSHKEGVKACL